MALAIRAYEPADHDACRALHVQLVEHHREIYESPSIGGDDPGAGFDEYLALADRVSTWVAVDDGRIVGMTGLLWSDGEATIEPVVVASGERRRGIGRRLVETAIEESRRLGAVDVNVKPVARNDSAIAAFHELGFRTVGHVQLFMRLGASDARWRDGLDIQGRRFEY
jgi:GNAT superfamily N-acetyltransferase